MFTILWIYDKSRIKGDVKKVVVLAGGNHTVEAPPSQAVLFKLTLLAVFLLLVLVHKVILTA